MGLIRSMTGYGRGFVAQDGREMTVELKSVNHRYLDISMRLPRHLIFLEDAFRKQLSARLNRGHVDIYLNYRNTRNDARTIQMDEALIGQYLQAASRLEEQYAVQNDLSASNLMRLPDAVSIVEAEEDREAVSALAYAATELALNELIAMRSAEGERLCYDFLERVAVVQSVAAQIAARAPQVVSEYRKKLDERIEALLREVEVDRARLATEVALFSDRASVDEEITRLNSHVAQFRDTLNDSEPVGRKLEFIVQEMNREFNTVGSKANDTELVNSVLQGKNEIEKIREQVQNIE